MQSDSQFTIKYIFTISPVAKGFIRRNVFKYTAVLI